MDDKKQTEHKSKNNNNSKKESKENKNSNENNKSLITVFIILGVIVALFIAFYFGSIALKNYQLKKELEGRTVIYDRFTFINETDGKWYTQFKIGAQPYIIPFYYNPFEVENISLDSPNTITKIKQLQQNPQTKVYITVNPDQSSKIVIAAFEISRILGTTYNIYNLNVSSAITNNNNQVQTDIPVITCQNQTGNVVVIWITVGDENKIQSADHCVIIEAKSIDETIMVADAFSYRILGMIN